MDFLTVMITPLIFTCLFFSMVSWILRWRGEVFFYIAPDGVAVYCLLGGVFVILCCISFLLTAMLICIVNAGASN